MPLKHWIGHGMGISLLLAAGYFWYNEYQHQVYWASYGDPEYAAIRELHTDIRASYSGMAVEIKERPDINLYHISGQVLTELDSVNRLFDSLFVSLDRLNSENPSDYMGVLQNVRPELSTDTRIQKFLTQEIDSCQLWLNKIKKSGSAEANKNMQDISYAFLVRCYSLILNFLWEKNSFISCGGFTHAPFCAKNVIHPASEDIQTYDFVLSAFCQPSPGLELYLNGRRLPLRDEVATIEKQFSRAGLHPLTIEVRWKDGPNGQVQSMEKTYYVRVRP